ncbi:MAG TPA: hypothetical protein VL424_08270 [Pararobbsia sp.]|jgi:hypothetical protein|nr:hypothetical protein [Pararobbsia sp.]
MQMIVAGMTMAMTMSVSMFMSMSMLMSVLMLMIVMRMLVFGFVVCMTVPRIVMTGAVMLGVPVSGVVVLRVSHGKSRSKKP